MKKNEFVVSQRRYTVTTGRMGISGKVIGKVEHEVPGRAAERVRRANLSECSVCRSHHGSEVTHACE